MRKRCLSEPLLKKEEYIAETETADDNYADDYDDYTDECDDSKPFPKCKNCPRICLFLVAVISSVSVLFSLTNFFCIEV